MVVTRPKLMSVARLRLQRVKQKALQMLGGRAAQAPFPPPVQPDYLTAVYNSPLSEAIFDCPIARCVNMYGFPYGPGGWHPFVALLERFRDGEASTYEGSVLESYYARWQPQNAGEILMVNQAPPDTLRELPAWAAYPPWIRGSRNSIMAMKRRVLEKENRIGGVHGLPLEVGFTGCGPVADEKGHLEYRRLVDLYRSIDEIGYERGQGDITGVVLRRGPDYRVVVKDGNHRLAALSVLGRRTAPIRLAQLVVVDANHVDVWPQVRDGVWDRESALRYFNHLFDLDSCAWAIGRGLL